MMVDMDKLTDPSPLTWVQNTVAELTTVHECYCNGQLLAWIEPRPSYCDRGHWKMVSELPGLDSHDSFPRYFMSLDRAVRETEDWLQWRLWKHFKVSNWRKNWGVDPKIVGGYSRGAYGDAEAETGSITADGRTVDRKNGRGESLPDLPPTELSLAFAREAHSK